MAKQFAKVDVGDVGYFDDPSSALQFFKGNVYVIVQFGDAKPSKAAVIALGKKLAAAI